MKVDHLALLIDANVLHLKVVCGGCGRGRPTGAQAKIEEEIVGLVHH